ncbi:hypothetical protein BH09SUM1_BH09SUM1_15500 [soil metagenome]
MFRLKLLPLFLIAMVAIFCVAPKMNAVSYAQTSVDEDVYRENTDIDKIFHKLGRGIVNVLTGWVEIPKNIAKEWRRTDPFTGTVVGLIKGLGWGIARTFAGFYEVISFPFPVPRNYEAIMQPEFVLPTVWGERLPLYRDEFIGSSGSTGAVNSAVDYGRSSSDKANGYDNRIGAGTTAGGATGGVNGTASSMTGGRAY